jgi:hypothetical protein
VKITIKTLAATTAIAGSVGIAALGLDSGTALAAHGKNSGSDTSFSSSHADGSSGQTSRGVGSDESGSGTAVPRTWYPEMPVQGG